MKKFRKSLLPSPPMVSRADSGQAVAAD